ncbi:MAG TPA: aspartate/glutamate racemase family protein [Candidatus Saccharimonadales bacterium]|nr:aspartate/glutamate racemase family protein [Candidatus Saccharimonadales bacterium]
MEYLRVDHESKVPPMKRIGVVGGFSQWATHDVIGRILKYSASRIPQYGNRGYPPMDQRWVNRAPMKLNTDGSMPAKLEPSDELLAAAKFVGNDSDFLIIPSNTPHFFKKEIEEAAGKSLLSIVDLAIEEVARRQSAKVGIMAIGPTLNRRLYQNPLEEKGFTTVVLSQELSEKLDEEGVYAIQEGVPAGKVGKVAFEALSYLRKQGSDSVILGCSEIPILLGADSEAPYIINPSQLLAEAAVEKALS